MKNFELKIYSQNGNIIDVGQTVDSADFIDSSENDGTSGDNGKVAKLEQVDSEHGKISREFLGKLSKVGADVIVGETIDGTTTPKACFISDGSTTNTTTNSNGGSASGSNSVSQNERTAQVFTNTRLDFITEVGWSESGTNNLDSGDTFHVEIYAVDGSNVPTGSALGTKAFVHNTNTYNDVCTFSSPIAVSRNTNYAVVVRGDSALLSNESMSLEKTATNTPSFPKVVQFYNGSWADSTNYARDFYVKGYQSLTAGKIYLSSTNVEQRKQFNGFIRQSVVNNDSAILFTDVCNGFPSLTGGSKYYFTTDGAISTSGDYSVGFATSSNSLELRKIFGTPIDVGNSLFTAPSTGFFYGTINDPDNATTVIGGITINFDNDGQANPLPFCFPCNKGDTITIGGTSQGYFSTL